MSDEIVFGWTGQQRSDGTVVLKYTEPEERWEIVRATQVVRACPCCNAPFRTARAAKLCANVIYPLCG